MSYVGIDLGTTHSLAAVYENGEARLIKNSIGEYLTPSVISVDKNDNILVGAPARERLISDPKNSVHAFKRMMGTDKIYKIGKNKFRPEELSSLILKSLKEDLEADLNKEVTDVVISVPAYFNDMQRNSTKISAELAGFNVLRLINEPTAASLVYGLHENEDEKHFLILDLGGGTFDVTILELFEGVFEVHASAGDNHLGGEDFTDIIVNWIKKQPECKKSKHKDSHIYMLAEKAKRELSDKNSVDIKLGDNLIITLEQNHFEKECEPLLARVRQPILKAINDAGLKPDDFDDIILVGGSTKMSVLKQFVTRLFGRFPQSRENPDTVVALGAAIQAGLVERGQGLDEMVLTDVMPYSLGIAVHNENNPDKDYFHPIIERNQTIPISRIESFHTIHKDQQEVNVRVYQGESRYIENNLLLDAFEIKFPKKGEIQSFEVRFTYDNNGILEINTQSHTEADIKHDRVIQQRSGQMTKEEVQKALEKISYLKIHPRDQNINKTIIERIERLYEQSLGEQRDYLADLITYFDKELAKQDPKAIEQARKELTDVLDEIEGSAWH